MSEKVTVYRFHYWDGRNDCWQRSNVWGTPEAIAATRIGVIDRACFVEIDAKHLDDRGMTQRGFDPHSTLVQDGGPQRQVH